MYYTVKVVTNQDDTETKSLQNFENYDDALVRYHKDLQENIGKGKSVLCKLFNEVGDDAKKEFWQAPEPTPEIETEEVGE